MLETLDYTIRIRSTPTFLYFTLFWPEELLPGRRNNPEGGTLLACDVH